jgi:flavin-dependent dehydrogenase
MQRFDAVVVGGGSSGLIAAGEAARRGLSVLLLEEDMVVGRPERCAGLYSIRGLERVGVRLSRSYVQNLLWGAVIRSPRGAELEIKASSPVAVVAEREALDRFLAEEALSSGAKVLVGTRVAGCSRVDDGPCKVVTEDGEAYRAGVVILAEGSAGRLARGIYKQYYAPYWMPIIQLVVRGHGLDPRRAHVWFKPYLRDFFGYLVPINEEFGRVGVAGKSDLHKKAIRLIREEMPQARAIGYMSHSIYRGPPLEHGLTGRVLLVGDAAGQVKATTGGGVVVGGICARAAGTHAYRLLTEGDEGAYRRMVRGLYRELKMIYWLSKALSTLSYSQLDMLIKAASESGFADALSRRGDMDLQVSGLALSIASTRGLSFLSHLVRSLI